MLEPKANIWVEQDGQVVLSRWRARLLRAIADTGSISAAAERMEVSYRRAWEKIEEMESGLGQALLERHTGGAGGGGASLTEAARAYLRCFEDFEWGVDELIRQRFAEAFGSRDGRWVGEDETL